MMERYALNATAICIKMSLISIFALTEILMLPEITTGEANLFIEFMVLLTLKICTISFLVYPVPKLEVFLFFIFNNYYYS